MIVDSQYQGFVEIVMRDTGCGIPMRHMDKIFNPLFTTRDKGAGLGLTIMHKIVDRHRGWLKVEQNNPSGTVFKIYLPASPAKN